MGPVEEFVLIVVCVTLPVGLCGAALSWKLGRLERKRQMFLTGTLAGFDDLEQRQRPSAGTHGAVVAMLAQEARAEHAGTDSRGACGVEAERANAAAANAPHGAEERARARGARVLLRSRTDKEKEREREVTAARPSPTKRYSR